MLTLCFSSLCDVTFLSFNMYFIFTDIFEIDEAYRLARLLSTSNGPSGVKAGTEGSILLLRTKWYIRI